MKRGRPKGRSRDTKSYGPLADLIRSARMARSLGLADVAKACRCSIQFISNIEHGRAPLPWEKAPALSRALGVPLEELQAANLAIRSDFKSFVGRGRSSGKASKGAESTASLMTLAAADQALREILEQYQGATAASRKRFFQAAKRALSSSAPAL